LAIATIFRQERQKYELLIGSRSINSVRAELGEMLNQVQYRHYSVIINIDGKPVAALVDARLFERIRRMQALLMITKR